MMTERTHREILARFPSRAELARRLGYPEQTVHSWFRRGVIPGHADAGLVKIAAELGVPVSFEELAAARSRPAQPEPVNG